MVYYAQLYSQTWEDRNDYKIEIWQIFDMAAIRYSAKVHFVNKLSSFVCEHVLFDQTECSADSGVQFRNGFSKW